jgi:serine/threonine protein kinase/class 3 adenylate cyclase
MYRICRFGNLGFAAPGADATRLAGTWEKGRLGEPWQNAGELVMAERYRLLTQIAVGRDGVSYRAERPENGNSVLVRLLNDLPNSERWPKILKRLRQVQLLTHPVALAILELDLEHDPPAVLLESVHGKSLAEDFGGRVPLAMPEAVALAGELAGGLAAAHRLGIVHYHLCPSIVVRTSAGQLKIDFTGFDVPANSNGHAPTALDASCLAPEGIFDGTSTSEADIYSLGAILYWLLEGKPYARESSSAATTPEVKQTLADGLPAKEEEALPLGRLLQAMLAVDPSERPSAREIENHLMPLKGQAAATGEFNLRKSVALRETTAGQGPSPDDLDVIPAQLGRFQIRQKLGQGGMGAVYSALDTTDGTQVAIKVLRGDWAQKGTSLQRFHKEARLLAEVNNPYVTNLLEVNEDCGIHYLALEYVEGKTLGKLLDERGQLNETTALRIIADVARALVTAHERGIVHRDIKPENILLVEGQPRTTEPEAESGPRVKLADFGLARHIVETNSLMVTQTGAIIGTPLYMAPEQCTGNGVVDARSDVYSLGVTLFHLLTGRPPFVGSTQLGVIAKHCNEPPPGVQTLNPQVSEGTCLIINKCLAKSPDARYANAAELLADLERILRGEPTTIVVHPSLPPCDPAKVLHYDWSWPLEASPQQLWPHVSNTDRLNQAVSLPPVQFTSMKDAERGVRRFGKFRKAGVIATWEEHPFEWVEAQRMGVLREYTQGPFKWMVSIVELAPRPGGGTLLSHRVRIEPSGLLGRTVAAVEVNIKGRRAVERVYRRIDAALTGKLGGHGLADPFTEPARLSGKQRRRLEQLLGRLNACGIDPGVVERLGDYLAVAPPQEVARIRPLALARRLGLDAEQVVAACLHGAREGLLVLLWDILCPVCRIPSEVKETLKALREHGRCEACNLDFELDFANSVEMIFRVHPQIRETELGIYCIGGPAHSPHVVAQVRVGAGERIELDLALGEGAYRLRGPQLPFTLDFKVQPQVSARRWDLNLARSPGPDLPRILQSGRQLLALRNDHSQELVARIERAAARDDALTAARASALATFRDLFPGEVLSPGQLVSVANVTFLVTALEGASTLYQERGDTKAFTLIHEHFRILEEQIRREGGALVKTVGEGVFAAFNEPVTAMRAALELQTLLAGNEATRELRLRTGLHRGPAMAAALNDHLDYFGTTVNLAAQLPAFAGGGDVILTQSVAADPQVAALLHARGMVIAVADELAPSCSEVLHRVLGTTTKVES